MPWPAWSASRDYRCGYHRPGPGGHRDYCDRAHAQLIADWAVKTALCQQCDRDPNADEPAHITWAVKANRAAIWAAWRPALGAARARPRHYIMERQAVANAGAHDPASALAQQAICSGPIERDSAALARSCQRIARSAHCCAAKQAQSRKAPLTLGLHRSRGCASIPFWHCPSGFGALSSVGRANDF